VGKGERGLDLDICREVPVFLVERLGRGCRCPRTQQAAEQVPRTRHLRNGKRSLMNEPKLAYHNKPGFIISVANLFRHLLSHCIAYYVRPPPHKKLGRRTEAI